jgi:hypothetical protein
MNLSLMLNRPKIHTKRIVDVDIERSQTKARLAQQRPVQTVPDALMPERTNIQLPMVLMDVTECQLTSAGSQFTTGQL